MMLMNLSIVALGRKQPPGVSYCCYYENPYISHLIESSKHKTKGIKSWFRRT